MEVQLRSGGTGDDRNDELRTRLIAFVPRLRRFCHGLTGDRDAGDDLLQAVVERVLTRAELWQTGTNLEGWVFRIARNLHIDQFRAAKSRGAVIRLDELQELGTADEVAALEMRSDLKQVRCALAEMPSELREVMTVVVIDGQAYKDAASLLEIPIGTVMSRLSRARRFIETYMTAPRNLESAC